MTRPVRLAALSLLAAAIVGASAIHLLGPRLALPAGARATPAQAMVRIRGLSIPSVPLDRDEMAVVTLLVADGIAIEDIRPSAQRQASFGPLAHFLDLQLVDGTLLVAVPVRPPLTASVCAASDGATYAVRLGGTEVVDQSRYPEWWLTFDGSVLMTAQAETYAVLRNAGAQPVTCAQTDAVSGVLHLDGLSVQAPPLLPAEVDGIHRLIAAGVVPTEADRVGSSSGGLFVHLQHGAVVLAGSCDDVRAIARATHFVGGGDPFAPDFLSVARLGELAAGTNDPAVWEQLQPATRPC